jgi:hypothetical protein
MPYNQFSVPLNLEVSEKVRKVSSIELTWPNIARTAVDWISANGTVAVADLTNSPWSCNQICIPKAYEYAHIFFRI